MTEQTVTENEIYFEFFDDFVVLLGQIAGDIKKHAAQGATDQEWADAQAMCVVEEAGEFIAEYRRWRGFARRSGDREQLLSELADVVISGMLMFSVLGEDVEEFLVRKLRKIVTRGYVNKEAS